MAKLRKCACGSQQKQPDIFEQLPQKKKDFDQYLETLELPDTLEKRRGLLIACLHKAQSIFGYLPQEIQEVVADKLRLQLSDVYGVISFYSFFTTKPVGKFKVSVCTGTACFVRGSTKILEEFKSKLKISEGETTSDGLVTLCCIRCVGACSLAPVVMVNETVYAKVTPRKVADIVKSFYDSLQQGASI